MEISPKLLQPIPFYMTYPGYFGSERESQMIHDMEYLQQMYPDTVKRCQRRVAEILDRTDYEGSMIYDEYPDRYSLLALTKSICRILEKEEDCQPAENMIQILLFNEVYKRRHGGRRGNIYF